MSANAPRIVFATTTATADYGQLVLCDTTAAGFTVTLPRPSIGLRPIQVKKTKDNTSNVTVARSGTALIDGATSVVLSNFNQAVTLVPNGTNWVVTNTVAGTSPSATVPGAPTIGTATAGVLNASVTFTAPVSDGGSAITGYTATSSPGGITGTGASSPITVSGLTAGTPYTFTVHATNAVGNSAESAASNSATPSASVTVPGAPTIGTAVGGDTTATANWTAPGSNGGSAITGYEVKTYDNAGTLLFTNTVGVVLTYEKTGLTNGTVYKFKVAAINAIGTGAQSAFSNTVTPAGFSPAAIPNALDWVEADQIPGPPADDAQLSSVASLVGSHSYAQATSGKQPIFKASVVAWNNKPVMRFTAASSQELLTAAPVMTATDNYAFCAVFSASGAAVDAVYRHGNLIAGNGYGMFAYGGNVANLISVLLGGIAWQDTDAATPSTPTIVMVRRTAGTTEIWVNGVPRTVGSPTSGPNTPGTASAIGSGNGAYHQGDVGGLFSANASVSKANLNALGNYWATKYGLSWTTIV